MVAASVILPMFRPGGIDITLAGLRGQTVKDYELIIIDHRYERRHKQVMELAREYGERFRDNFSLENLRMLQGLGELDQDFVIEYNEMGNEELKRHRARITEYIYKRGLNADD